MTNLRDDEHGVLQLLPPEHRVEVPEEDPEVPLPVPEGHEDGDAVARTAVGGAGGATAGVDEALEGEMQ